MFSFNAYSGLLLLGCVQGLVFGAILALRARREGRLSDALAALILLVGALYAAQWMLGFGGWYDGRDGRATVMFYVEWSHLLALGPLIWLYFRALTNTDFRWRRDYWWHFAPAAAFALPVAVAGGYDWGAHAGLLGRPFEGFGGSRGPAMEVVHTDLGVLGAVEDALARLHLPAYLYLTLRAYGRFREYLREGFSNAEDLDLTGLRNLLYVLLAGVGLAFGSDVLAYARGVDGYGDVWYRYFFVSAMTYAAALQFYALDLRRTGRLRHDPQSGEATTTRVTTAPRPEATAADAPSAPAPDLEPWATALEARLREHRDYLEPDLRLADLAARVGTNASVMSRVINTRYGVNFNDFVNARRCAAFVEAVRRGEHERHTLLSLALESGFNSKSTFNRAFRRAYGYPPGEAAARLVPNRNPGGPKS